MPTLIDAPTSIFALDEEARRRIELIVDQHAEDPVDSPFSEAQQSLLSHILDHSWTPPPVNVQSAEPRKFWAAANVGIFASAAEFLVPDNFVALGMESPSDEKDTKAFYLADHDPPVVAFEVVSNRVGNEMASKLEIYARWGIKYYIVYDRWNRLRGDAVYIFALQHGKYVRTSDGYMPELGLGVKIWRGVYAHRRATYLRWCDSSGDLLLTADEDRKRQAETIRQKDEDLRRATEEARRHAEEARRNAEEARRNGEERDRLAALLRELGINPAGGTK